MLPSKKGESDILCRGNTANRTGNLLSPESKYSTSKRCKHVLMKPSWVKTLDFGLYSCLDIYSRRSRAQVGILSFVLYMCDVITTSVYHD